MPLRDIATTLIVTACIFIAFRQPHIGLLCWAWLGYMNPHRLGWGFAYNMPFVMATAAVTLLAWMFSREPKSIPITPITVLLIIFILWTTLASATAMDVTERLGSEWVRFIKVQVMIFVTLALFHTQERIIQLVWTIVVSIGYFSIKGGVFSIMTGGSFRVWGPPGSFITGNNELALAGVMILPLMWFLYLYHQHKWVKRGLLVAIGLAGIAILMSYSRGAFLALSAIAFFLWLKSRQKIGLGLLLLLLLGVFLAFLPEQWYERISTISTASEEDESFRGRMNSWYFAINLAKDHPLFGGGFGVFNVHSLIPVYSPGMSEKFVDAHSIYFEVLAEQGFAGLFLFLTLFFAGFFTAGRTVRLTRDMPELRWARDLSAMLQVSLIGYGVGGAALGLAYFDLPYHILALIVLVSVYVRKTLPLYKTHAWRGRGPIQVRSSLGSSQSGIVNERIQNRTQS